MQNDPRIDPEMAAFTAMLERRAAEFPPLRLMRPLDDSRAANDALIMTLHNPEPTMADSRDHWLPIRGRRIQCRLHRPTPDASLPVFIQLHSGGWVWNSIDTHDTLMRRYAAASGFAVVGVDYALSPEAVFPQALEEVAGVVRWVAAHGSQWGLDGARIIVGGDSAGANLALGAALLLHQSDPDLRLSGLLLCYGAYDDRMASASYEAFGEGYGLTRDKMRFYWDCYAPALADRMSPYAAPIRADLRGMPPTLVQFAELDVLADENRAMAAALRAAGVNVEEETCHGMMHGFLRATEHVSGARRAVATASVWMQRVG